MKWPLLVAIVFNICFIQCSPVPVIFVHSNDSDYLEHTLSQAKQFNDVVLLIGDDTNKHYAKDGIQHYQLADYSKSSTEFKTI